MDPDAYRLKIEKDILDIVEARLLTGDMEPERASAIAKMVLEKLHPPLTLEQIYAIVPTLDDEFTELGSAVLPVLKEHDEKVRSVVTEHAEKLIQSGKLDEALAHLKDASGR